MGIGGFRVRALHDSGASRTAVGPIGLQIATACGKEITPYRGVGARLTNGRTAAVLGHVDLPFDVAGRRHYLDIVILEELDADCLLGADFMKKFNVVLWPHESTRSVAVWKKKFQKSCLKPIYNEKKIFKRILRVFDL